MTLQTKTLALITIAGLVSGQGRNLAMGNNGIIIGTFAPGSLIVRLADGSIATQTLTDLAFDDVAIDGNLVFGLSTANTNVCSFTMNGDGVLSSTNNCISGVSVTPFSGVAVSREVLVVHRLLLTIRLE